METNELPLASGFQPKEGEANFGPPLLREVRGGMHIAPECIVLRGQKFVMVEWPNGLSRHETSRTVRFPHGLMLFGETIQGCAQRLVRDQMGANVKTVKVLEIDSYVDDANHWHIEPLLCAHIEEDLHLPPEASRFVEFEGSKLPDGAVWGATSFERVLKQFF